MVKNTKISSFVKIGAAYTISNMIVKGIAFLTTPLFTRLMSQTEFGDFNSIASWANIISVLVTLNLYSSISRAKYDYDEDINGYMSSIVILGVGFTGVCWLMVELNMSFFERLLSMNAFYIRILLLYSMFSPALQTLLTKYKMYNEYKKVVALTWLTLIASTLTSLIFVFLFNDKLLGRVVGNYIVIAAINAFLFIYILIKGKGIRIEHVKYSLFLALPLVPHELSGILLSSSDRIIIQKLCGSKEVALYSLVYTIAMIVTVLLSSLNQAWVPWFYDNLHKENTNGIKKVTNLYTRLFTCGCILLMLTAPELVLLFGGDGYQEATYIIPPVCVAIELQFAYTLYVNIEFYEKKTWMISVATIVATITNIVLNYAFIPVFGYSVAAYTTIVGYLMMFISHYLMVKYKTNYNHVFNIYDILKAIACTVLFSIFSMWLYGQKIIRWIILGIIVVVILKGVLIKKEREQR